jgi:uncharacterized protein
MPTPFWSYHRETFVGCIALLALAACKRGEKAAAIDSTAVRTPVAAAPAFNASLDCSAAPGAIEQAVCGDTALSGLDQKLGIVYRDAESRQGPPVPDWFVNDQRSWNATRDACLTGSNVRACLDSTYIRRIAAIQATSLLVPARGPIVYNCTPPGGAHDEVVATFAETVPRTAVLERGDKSVVLYQSRSGSGARYQGNGVELWTKGDQAQVTWMGTALKCRELAPSS